MLVSRSGSEAYRISALNEKVTYLNVAVTSACTLYKEAIAGTFCVGADAITILRLVSDMASKPTRDILQSNRQLRGLGATALVPGRWLQQPCLEQRQLSRNALCKSISNEVAERKALNMFKAQ